MTDHQEHIIASLAILMVNWDDDRTNDYLRPFSRMLAEVISQYDQKVLAVDKLQKEYERIFGLKLPAGVIRSLLRRLERENVVQRENGYYTPNRKRLSSGNFSRTRKNVLADYDSLIRHLIEYCASKFKTAINRDEAEENVENFLAEHQFVLLNALVSGKEPIIPLHTTRDPKHKYLTGSFITEIARMQARDFQYLETVLQGMMLANVLYLPDNKSIKKTWTTAFYFDTPFLIESLGFQGNITRDLRLELLSALRSTGAKTMCFVHNVDEVRSILFACLKILERRDFSRVYGPMATTIDYMIEENYTPAEVYLALSTVDDKLASIGIKLRNKPEYVDAYVVDEIKLETLLMERYSNSNSEDKGNQRKNDIDSVASIYRLRRGEPFRKIEDCKAVFVTHNVALLQASHELFGESENDVAHCLTDFTLSNLLWLTRPDALPDMPRKQIIADAYAATQPDYSIWKRYVSKIEDLRKRGAITPDDFYAFRYTQEARNCLMEITQGSGEVLTDGTVQQILRSVKSKFQQEAIHEASRKQAELQRQADTLTQDLSRQLEREQQERQKLVDKQQRAVGNRRERARQLAKRSFMVLKFSIALANIVILLASSPLEILSIDLNQTQSIVQFVILCIWVVLSLMVVWEMQGGKRLHNRIDDAETRLAEWLEQKLSQWAQ